MKLSINIKIYDVIFITHLKSVIDSAKDLYWRRRLLTSVVLIDDKKKYEIEKLLKKRIIKRKRK